MCRLLILFFEDFSYEVPEVGIEPTRPFEQSILSRFWLPITALGLAREFFCSFYPGGVGRDRTGA